MLSKSRLRWERLVTLSERLTSAISVERKEWSFAVPKGPKSEKRPADVIGAAITVAKIATGEIEEQTDDDGKDKAAVELGRKGGKALKDEARKYFKKKMT